MAGRSGRAVPAVVEEIRRRLGGRLAARAGTAGPAPAVVEGPVAPGAAPGPSGLKSRQPSRITSAGGTLGGGMRMWRSAVGALWHRRRVCGSAMGCKAKNMVGWHWR
jgi:hypothetical protein